MGNGTVCSIRARAFVYLCFLFGYGQGNRDSIDAMAPGSAKILEQVLKLVDAYDLYGRCDFFVGVVSSGCSHPHLDVCLLGTALDCERWAR